MSTLMDMNKAIDVRIPPKSHIAFLCGRIDYLIEEKRKLQERIDVLESLTAHLRQ